MNLSLKPPTPLEYFATLVQGDTEFPLLEAAACLGSDDYPDAPVHEVLDAVDQLLARLRRRLPSDAATLHKLRVLNQFLYGDLKFGGNFNDYADPDNSYLHRVLSTRRAIPVSMAVIWLELAQGLGLNAQGVCFPGYFMVKVMLSEGQVVVDPLNGRSQSREALSERLCAFGHLEGLIEDDLLPLGYFLQAASPREIIARMLRNLKEIHHANEDWMRLVAVQDRLIVLLPGVWSETRDRGLALAEAGYLAQALSDLEAYLHHGTAIEDRDAVSARVAELRRALH